MEIGAESHCCSQLQGMYAMDTLPARHSACRSLCACNTRCMGSVAYVEYFG